MPCAHLPRLIPSTRTQPHRFLDKRVVSPLPLSLFPTAPAPTHPQPFFSFFGRNNGRQSECTPIASL